MRQSLTRTARHMVAVLGALLIGAGVAAVPASAAAPARAQSVTLEQTGGLAGVQRRFTVDTSTPGARRDPLLATVARPDFLALEPSYVSGNTCCDRFVYELTVRYPDGRVKSVVTVEGGGAPALVADVIARTKALGTPHDVTPSRSLLFVERAEDAWSTPDWWIIDCPADPANTSDAACAALTARAEASLAPVPPGTACTRIWGGPQTARVLGVWRGGWVDAEFSRRGGCEIARWDGAAALLTPPPQR
ncbi:protealysin inhibitor emfourin [Longispora sp. K20-0274]|uniref:protealysin inhibitor emfourin n=1 Tax=Longispora sp. K20-0274 TaxID=3088255 RepID=UPI00399B6638